ncbi:hypothetical protein BDD12DRAFT_214587 [Trichophaea hybrida]|nr:hypothetical protein BDD12DRAFT_214587 [Trichophaea hybrida]
MADDALTSRPTSEAAVGDATAQAAITSSSGEDANKKGETAASGDDTIAVSVAGGDASKTNGGDKKELDTTTNPAASAAVEAAPSTAAAMPAKKTPRPSKKKSVANLKKTPGKNAAAAEQRFKPGDYVMAKMRSFPPWPAIVLSKELLPEIMVTAPAGGKAKSLETVGATAWQTQYPIFYMGTYEYSWISVADLDPLTKDKIDAGAAARKTKKLAEAFQEARQDFSLEDVKELQETTIECDEEPAVEPEPEEDEMELDEEEIGSDGDDKPAKKTSRGKKRKKSETASDDEAESEKPAKTPKKNAAKAKTPKSTTKATPTAKTPKTPKTPANGVKASAKKGTAAKEKATPGSSKAKKLATPAAKGKKGAKSKEVVESESEGSATETRTFKDPRGLPEEEQHKLMLHRRHRLQKAFLNKDKTPPSEQEMQELSGCLKALESWPDMPAELIKSTKIHKVLRGICKVEFAIPLEDKFKFKERSKVLHDKWMEVLRTTEKTEDGAIKEEESSEVKTEGEAKENGIGGDEAPAATNGDSEVKDEPKTGGVVKEVEMRDAPQDGGEKESVEASTEAGKEEA